MPIPDFTALHANLNNGGYPAPSDPNLTPVSIVDLHTLLDGIETETRNRNIPDDICTDNIHDRITDAISSHVTGNLIDKNPGETFDEIDDDDHQVTLSRGLLRRILTTHTDNNISTTTGYSDTERDIVHSSLVENFTDDFERWFNRAILDQNTVVYIRVKRDTVPAAAANTTVPDVYESIFLDMTDPRVTHKFNDSRLTEAVNRATTAHEKAQTVATHLNDSLHTTSMTARRYTDPDTTINLVSRGGRANTDPRNTTVTTCPPAVVTDHITREPLHTWRLTDFH